MLSIGQDEPDVPPASTAPPRDPPRREEMRPPTEEFRFGESDLDALPPNDVRVSGPNEALAEVLIDVNPTNPLNLVICGHSSSLGWMNTYCSFDGGATWTYVRVGSEQDHFPFEYRFDPALAFDGDGNVYVGYGIAHGTLPQRFTDVIVCKSTDGGRTYTQSASAGSARTVQDLLGNDKFCLATGRDPVVEDRQNVYVAWTWNIPTMNNLDQQIAVSASTDGGATFSAPRVINDNSIFGRDRALFADPSVGPNGELYVSWHDFDNQARIMVDRSFDGGVTWGSDVLVAPFALGLKTPIPPQPDRGVAAGPVMDVDISNGPHRGRAYLAYCHAGAFGFDVSLRYSDDQAATWSQPVRVCDDPTLRSQFLPWLDVGRNDGTVSVVFYDAREDPLDRAARVYSAVSRTGGESFEQNQPVADVSSNMTAANPYRYLGNYLEYIGVATHDCAAYVVWTDNRNQWPVYQGGISYYYFDRVPFETNPPQITCPAPLEVECDGNGGLLVTDPRAVAFLGGCQAVDDCAPECVITWRARQPGVIYNNLTKFTPGAYTVEFTARDTAGNTTPCDASLTVLDSSPPSLDVTITPDVLWPPDHRMVDVRATVSARDACAPQIEVLWELWSIDSDEPTDAEGDGSTAPDIETACIGCADVNFRLRAERSGEGDGRKYRIVYHAVDDFYEAFDTVYVTVPHDAGREIADLENNGAQVASPAATVLYEARPNPFNPQTTITFELAIPRHVQLMITDVRGARVRVLVNESLPRGVHQPRWDGHDDSGQPVASGIYFVRMQAGTYTAVRKLVLLK